MENIKKDLRAKMLSIMESLPTSYTSVADRKIAEKILAWDVYKDAHTIFTFVTMNNEINTIPIIEHALSHEKIVCAPKCYAGGIMEAKAINSLDQIVLSKKNIPEPEESCPPVAPENIDLILVPCLAANKKGLRLGYGGGYYDRYLANYDGNTVVLCREKQLQIKIPADSYDVPTGFYVTENGLNPSS